MVLGCNIHDLMVAWILVVATSFYDKTDARTAFERMKSVLLLIAVAGLALVAVGSRLARHSAQSLNMLVANTERLGHGDCSQAVED